MKSIQVVVLLEGSLKWDSVYKENMFLVFVSFWNLPHLHKNKTINKGIRTIAHDFVRIKVVSMDGRIFRSCYCCCCFLLVVHKIISNEDTNTGGGDRRRIRKRGNKKDESGTICYYWCAFLWIVPLQCFLAMRHVFCVRSSLDCNYSVCAACALHDRHWEIYAV